MQQQLFYSFNFMDDDELLKGYAITSEKMLDRHYTLEPGEEINTKSLGKF